MPPTKIFLVGGIFSLRTSVAWEVSRRVSEKAKEQGMGD
jgi:hypothetical protein